MDLTPEQYAETAAQIEAEVGKVIVGQRELVRTVVTCLFAEGHVLLEGIPGVGKTDAVEDAVAGRRPAVQPDPVHARPDAGRHRRHPGARGGRARPPLVPFRQGPVFASFVLADEVNRASPKTQSALLEAMQERAVTAGGQTRRCRGRSS